MEPRTQFIRGLSFQRLASDDEALIGFKQLLISIRAAKWKVFKAEETVYEGEAGLMIFMTQYWP